MTRPQSSDNLCGATYGSLHVHCDADDGHKGRHESEWPFASVPLELKVISHDPLRVRWPY